MKTTIKEIFTSNNWIITGILQGYSGMVRIDAQRRYPVADKPTFFSNWCTEKYANRLAVENYGKRIKEFINYKY